MPSHKMPRPELPRRPTPSPPDRWTPCPGARTFFQPRRPRRRRPQRGLCPSPTQSSLIPSSLIQSSPVAVSLHLLFPRPRSRPALHRPRRASPPRPRRNWPGGQGALPRRRSRQKRPRRVASFLRRSRPRQPSPLQRRHGSRAAAARVRPPARRRRGAPSRPRLPPAIRLRAVWRAGPAALPSQEQQTGRRNPASQQPSREQLSHRPRRATRPVRAQGRPPLYLRPAALRQLPCRLPLPTRPPRPPRPVQAFLLTLEPSRPAGVPLLLAVRPRRVSLEPRPGAAGRVRPALARGLVQATPAQAVPARQPAGAARPRARARRRVTRAGAACVPWPSTCAAWTGGLNAT